MDGRYDRNLFDEEEVNPFSLAGVTNANSTGSFSTITAYWNEVFHGTPMPDAIRALLPSSTKISGSPFGRLVRSAWGSRWGVLAHDHNTFDRSNWSRNLAPLYFLRDELLPGSKMNVTMMISSVARNASAGEPAFLPRERAQGIPFSISNFTAILKMYSIDTRSERASFTRQTLVDCGMPALRGEVKHCATSLESMIDFVVAELGTREIHAVTTSAVNREEAKARSYRVGVGGGRLMSRKIVSCHNMMFPFSVFYCHNFAGTRAYMVPLIADDGSRVNAIALCHFDTSSWNPGHASFQVLGVKPGTVPICHFILQDLAWIPNGSA